MIICFSSCTSLRNLFCVGESLGKQMFGQISTSSGSPSNSRFYFQSSQFQQKYAAVTICKTFFSSSFGSQVHGGRSLRISPSKQKRSLHQFRMSSFVSSTGRQLTRLNLSSQCQNLSLRVSIPRSKRIPRICWNMRPRAWLLGGTSAVFCVSFARAEPASAEASMGNNDENDVSILSSSHGKKVHTDYSITGIPGDGRCLFRSVAHGACVLSGKPLPNESLQRELADVLRARVADEFIKRRAETEWFIEGDFHKYVSEMRKPHVWGGEPELLMASHVLEMPISVYMHDEDSDGLIAIAEYGQEYGKENPIRVLYHGFGHYDALQIPGKGGAKSRL